MNRSIEPQYAGYATAHRCLVLARDLADVAARLRTAAAELLEASASSGQPIAAVELPRKARAAAVDIYRRGSGGREDEPTLGAGNAVTTTTALRQSCVLQRSIEDANDELRAVRHWGAWQPTKRRARTPQR